MGNSRTTFLQQQLYRASGRGKRSPPTPRRRGNGPQPPARSASTELRCVRFELRLTGADLEPLQIKAELRGGFPAFISNTPMTSDELIASWRVRVEPVWRRTGPPGPCRVSKTVTKLLLHGAESSPELQGNKAPCWDGGGAAGLELTQRADKETACKQLPLAKILLLQKVPQQALTEPHTTFPKCM